MWKLHFKENAAEKLFLWFGYRDRNTVTMGQANKDFILFYRAVFSRSYKLCFVFGVFRLDKSFQFRHLVIVEILIY